MRFIALRRPYAGRQTGAFGELLGLCDELYSTQHNKRVEEIESFRNRLGDESTDKALVMYRAECESGLEERKQMSRTAVRRRSAWPATSAIFDCSFHSLMQPSEYGMIEQASHAISVSARRQVDLPQLPQ